MGKHSLLTIAGVLAVYLAIAPAVSAQDGNRILAKVDSVMNAPKDMVAIEKMTLIDANGSKKVRNTKIYQKGSEWRLVRFLSPADVRGVSFLRLASDRLYLYLPAFRRVRRIASSVKNENFMGTDFTYEDMSQSRYAPDYTARLLSEKEGQYVLELTPRPGADVSYGKLVMYVDTSNYVFRRIEYYGRRGNLEKVLTVDNVRQINGYWIGARMAMRNERDGHRTVMELSEVTFDQNLSDDVFSQRNLRRPER